MVSESDLVTVDNGPRPAGLPDRCFYCRQQIGELHDNECVLLTREIMLKATILYRRDVPQTWDKGMIEFHFNEGAWCADNLVEDLEDFRQFLEGSDGCLCPQVSIELVEKGDEW